MNERFSWRSPEELIHIGFTHSSHVVLMNEAYNGLQRCIRVRQIGQRIISTAHRPAAMAYSFKWLHSLEILIPFRWLVHVANPAYPNR